MPGCHTASRHQSQQKLLVGLLARLVGNAAAGLASALAGSLAFAAAAVQQALSHVAGLESLDVLHKTVTPLYILELLLLYTEIRGLSIGAEGKTTDSGRPVGTLPACAARGHLP